MLLRNKLGGFTHVIQTLPVLENNVISLEADLSNKKNLALAGLSKTQNKKTGVEPAENGSSFLAILKNMIVSNKEGVSEISQDVLGAHSMLVRGAGDLSQNVLETKIPKKESKDGFNGLRTEKKIDSKFEKKDVETKKNLKNESLNVKNLVKKQESFSDVISNNQKNLEDSTDEKKLNPKEKIKKETIPNSINNSAMAQVETSFNVKNSVSVKKSSLEQEIAKESKIEKKTKNDKKSTIEVRDERKKNTLELQTSTLFDKELEIQDDNSADLSFSFKDTHSSIFNQTEPQSQMIEEAGRKEQNFASMLSQELRSNASDFVKTGQIILRDNNAGLIRLTLHPESLGNVKISLELSGDKKITGKIQVSSKEAWDAFNENLDSISKAFTEGGFDTAGFDLSWSGSDANQQFTDAQASIKAPFYASSVPDVMLIENFTDTNLSETHQYSNAVVNFYA